MKKIELVSEIKEINFSNSWQIKIQIETIEIAKKYTNLILKKYNKHPNSINGCYICSDTFKELFSSFQKVEDRFLTNDAVHNASAVLAATQFEEVLKRNEPNKIEAIFITGIPGAGKTTSVRKFMDKANIKLIFEGQLANPASSISKIEKCLEKGLSVTIVAVHITLEKALENTFKRFNEYGRGGSIDVMSSIQGNLPSGLKKLKEYFGDKINIIAIDRNNGNKILQDETEIANLINIGSKDETFSRLKIKLDRDFKNGKISEICFNQANKTNLTNIMLNQRKLNL